MKGDDPILGAEREIEGLHSRFEVIAGNIKLEGAENLGNRLDGNNACVRIEDGTDDRVDAAICTNIEEAF